MQTFTVKPINKREHHAVERLGASGWTIIEESKPICMSGRTAVLIEKHGYTRWVLKEQVTED